MPKKFFIFFIFYALSSQIIGQARFGEDFEIYPFGGYFFGGVLSVNEGKLNIKNNANYGGSIGIKIRNPLRAEITYNRVDTRLVLEKPGVAINEELFDMSVNYIHGGITWTVKKGKVQPFGIFSSGVVIFAPSDPKYRNQWVFSFSVGGGVKYYFNRRIGLRFQAKFNVPYYFYGTSIYWGPGGGGYGVVGGSAIAQADISGGIIFAFP